MMSRDTSYLENTRNVPDGAAATDELLPLHPAQLPHPDLTVPPDDVITVNDEVSLTNIHRRDLTVMNESSAIGLSSDELTPLYETPELPGVSSTYEHVIPAASNTSVNTDGMVSAQSSVVIDDMDSDGDNVRLHPSPQ